MTTQVQVQAEWDAGVVRCRLLQHQRVRARRLQGDLQPVSRPTRPLWKRGEIGGVPHLRRHGRRLLPQMPRKRDIHARQSLAPPRHGLAAGWKLVRRPAPQGRQWQPGDPQPYQDEGKEKCGREHGIQQEPIDLLSDGGRSASACLASHDRTGRRSVGGVGDDRAATGLEGRLRHSLNQQEGGHDHPHHGNDRPRAKQPTGPSRVHKEPTRLEHPWRTVVPSSRRQP